MTEKLTVVAAAYYTSMERCSMLVESCKKLDIHLHLFGMGEPWPGLYTGKVYRLRREIDQIDSSYILVTDSSDSFFLANSDDILTKYMGMNVPVVISAEKNCWPSSLIESYYPKISSPWCYLNSGGYIGRKEEIVSVLSYMEGMPILDPLYRSRDWDNDQFRFSLLYIDSQPSIKLDSRCEIFQTMGNVVEGDVEWRDGYLRNLITNTYPQVIHYNGHAPGMQKDFKTLYNRLPVERI